MEAGKKGNPPSLLCPPPLLGPHQILHFLGPQCLSKHFLQVMRFLAKVTLSWNISDFFMSLPHQLVLFIKYIINYFRYAELSVYKSNTPLSHSLLYAISICHFCQIYLNFLLFWRFLTSHSFILYYLYQPKTLQLMVPQVYKVGGGGLGAVTTL